MNYSIYLFDTKSNRGFSVTLEKSKTILHLCVNSFRNAGYKVSVIDEETGERIINDLGEDN